MTKTSLVAIKHMVIEISVAIEDVVTKILVINYTADQLVTKIFWSLII
jgi:hypothetical protein